MTEKLRTSILKLNSPNKKSNLLEPRRLLPLLLKLLLRIEFKLRIDRSELLYLKAKLPARLPTAQNKRWLLTSALSIKVLLPLVAQPPPQQL